MKVELKTPNTIWLTAENPKEDHFLEVLDKHGIRVHGRSSSGIGLCSPHIAGLRQLFINREQQAILSYALAKVEFLDKLRETIYAGDFATMRRISQVAENIMELTDQLFVAPEPIIARALTAPARAPVSRPPPITRPPAAHAIPVKTEKNLFKIQGGIETDLPLEQWNKDFVAWTTSRGESFGGAITPIRQKPVPQRPDQGTSKTPSKEEK